MTNQFMAAAITAALAAGPASAQTVSDLLQKGIYAQEAAGDLDGAIQLFRQAITASASSRTLAGKAVYRMGSAQAAKGDMAAASQTFRQLIDQYPEQKDLAARLQQYLPAFKPADAQSGFSATIYRDSGSGLSFALPPGWTATQSAVDSRLPNPGVNIWLNNPNGGDVSIGVWVRTQKTDPASVPQKILATPDQKEAQLRQEGRADFTIRRETVKPVHVGADQGLSAVADYTDTVDPMHGVVLFQDGKAVPAAPQISRRVAELFTWVWGANVRILIYANGLDPSKLGEYQPVFDSIVNTFVVP